MLKYILLLIGFWCLLLGGVFLWQYDQHEDHRFENALTSARAIFQEIVMTRAWNASHGGVYVPVTEKTQPNPYLEDPLRDVVTTSGIKLTKINPAFMTRQISEIADTHPNGVHTHITSLNPIRPENSPLAWEKEALYAFAKGKKDTGNFILENGKPLFRYMAPLYVEQSCLKCHAKQGYKIGEVRGGVSLHFPYSEHEYQNLLVGVGVVGVVGILFIIISGIIYEKKRILFDAIFHQPVPSCLTDTDFNIIAGNDAYWELFGGSNEPLIKCFDHRPGEKCHSHECPITKIMDGEETFSYEGKKKKEGFEHYFIATAKPFKGRKGKILGVVETFTDITARKKLEDDLRSSLEQVKVLKGILPICASCKKVRNDGGYWQQVEKYIAEHSEAEFSHGICPDCTETLYPQYAGKLKEKKEKNRK